MNNDWCCICGEDACDELREGSPVCDFHRSMVDGGYTLDELREERDAEDDDTQKLPDISHLVNALSTDYPPTLSPIEQALHWAQNNGGILSADILKAAVLQLAAENEALKAALKPFAETWLAFERFDAQEMDDDAHLSFAEWFDRYGAWDLLTEHSVAAARALKAEDGA